MSKIDNFPYPTPIPAEIWGCFPVMFGSAESEIVRLISRISAVELFSQNSNLYDHDTSTYTGGQLALAIARYA